MLRPSRFRVTVFKRGERNPRGRVCCVRGTAGARFIAEGFARYGEDEESVRYDEGAEERDSVVGVYERESTRDAATLPRSVDCRAIEGSGCTAANLAGKRRDTDGCRRGAERVVLRARTRGLGSSGHLRLLGVDRRAGSAVRGGRCSYRIQEGTGWFARLRGVRYWGVQVLTTRWVWVRQAISRAIAQRREQWNAVLHLVEDAVNGCASGSKLTRELECGSRGGPAGQRRWKCRSADPREERW